MDKETDLMFETEAIVLLKGALAPCELTLPEGCPMISKLEIVEMFHSAGEIRDNSENSRDLILLADTVFVTCVQLVRATCINDPQARFSLSHGMIHVLNPALLIECLRNAYQELKALRR